MNVKNIRTKENALALRRNYRNQQQKYWLYCKKQKNKQKNSGFHVKITYEHNKKKEGFTRKDIGTNNKALVSI